MVKMVFRFSHPRITIARGRNNVLFIWKNTVCVTNLHLYLTPKKLIQVDRKAYRTIYRTFVYIFVVQRNTSVNSRQAADSFRLGNMADDFVSPDET